MKPIRHSLWLLLSLATPVLAAPLQFDGPFDEHAVLQRDQPLHIRGQGTPGAQVQVRLGPRQAVAKVRADGHWVATLAAQPAGGPFVLEARSGDAQVQAADVLLGDVWLCSGQSNMELPVERTLDARSELLNARHDDIRLLSIAQAASPQPLATFATAPSWQRADGDSVREFSAACYYFARELQQRVQVPMGLIDASWGGSRIQAWLSADVLARAGLYAREEAVLARYAQDPQQAAAQWGTLWQGWWRQQPGIADGDAPWDPLSAPQGTWSPAPVALGAWEHWGVPALAAFDGLVWFRAEVELTAAQAAQARTLAIGSADEIDMTWANGRAVGSRNGGEPRAYALPAGLLHAGRNLVTVAVLDTYRDGGLIGPPDAQAVILDDGSRVPLSGWQYRAMPAGFASPPPAPWQSASGLSTLYNGMIAPLGAVGLRGALWYQGESNTGEPALYGRLLRLYRQDLRRQFGAALPLLVVQLAGYGAPPTQPDESGWASLREQQRSVVAEDAHSGLAVAVDIGERTDIHPANKQELGRRLARVARHVVYGEALAPAGPVADTATREGGAVVLRLAQVEQGLVAYSAARPIGFELCGEVAGTCRYVDARIEGAAVTLDVPAGAPAARVRYCWADNPVCTLYDGNGLPAGPFEIPVH
ncbi:sialate O-acetylesterase [Stenotrophomonas sp. HITSZ_GD]|uniref:sialate O-acetylesterase n=1 Tax=Stenotrophomonas sp. HITSZ_GD TaxID=3037248 RepID=UPI00240DD159|nr:sialate O-acetylesterase [Stenotrophomonas sp. HITSZ_GD]MDG2524283.1 sialate O-acetylesterase [Stenotrophomonas sp. HITSZ_GD]